MNGGFCVPRRDSGAAFLGTALALGVVITLFKGEPGIKQPEVTRDCGIYRGFSEAKDGFPRKYIFRSNPNGLRPDYALTGNDTLETSLNSGQEYCFVAVDKNIIEIERHSEQ